MMKIMSTLHVEIFAICLISMYLCVYSCADCGYFKKDWSRKMGWCAHAGSTVHIGDFNGDGQTDMMCHDNIGRIWTSLAKSDGTFVKTTWFSGSYRFCKGSETANSDPQLLIGDFNGDGRSDIMCHCKNSGKKIMALATPDGTFGGVQWHTNLPWCVGGIILIGDFNGDKKDDMLCHINRRSYVAFTKGKFGFTGNDWSQNKNWCGHDTSRLYVGDFNGDNRTDILCSDKSGNLWVAYARSNLKQLFGKSDWHKRSKFCLENGKKVFIRIGDVNGDNRDDLVCHTKLGTNAISFSLPNKGFGKAVKSRKWCNLDERGFFIGYFNKGKKADLLCHASKGGQKWILYGQCPVLF